MKTLATLDRPSWLPSSAWPWQPSALSHAGGRVAVTDTGHGPTLLFVHVGSWSFVWRDVLLRLQNGFRCITVDAPGCGLSDRLPTPTLAQAGDAVIAVIDALQLRDVTLVAHDLGGPAGFLAAAKIRPDHPPTLLRLATCHLRLRQYPQAVAALQKAAKLEPGRVEHHNWLGLSLFAAGECDAAEEAFRQAERLQPGNGFSRKFLSKFRGR